MNSQTLNRLSHSDTPKKYLDSAKPQDVNANDSSQLFTFLFSLEAKISKG